MILSPSSQFSGVNVSDGRKRMDLVPHPKISMPLSYARFRNVLREASSTKSKAHMSPRPRALETNPGYSFWIACSPPSSWLPTSRAFSTQMIVLDNL